eukprot:TRINITY_DN12765_c0_g1_i1.p1 TRINITY_DN12765_c0_g1~~TRINITY_DN12765_c0_g1_i1.p1  ORF type:complete len:582 (-),score=169.20 TRINITY_DN12765_c0_g1_i1:39-1739(-)
MSPKIASAEDSDEKEQMGDAPFLALSPRSKQILKEKQAQGEDISSVMHSPKKALPKRPQGSKAEESSPSRPLADLSPQKSSPKDLKRNDSREPPVNRNEHELKRVDSKDANNKKVPGGSNSSSRKTSGADANPPSVEPNPSENRRNVGRGGNMPPPEVAQPEISAFAIIPPKNFQPKERRFTAVDLVSDKIRAVVSGKKYRFQEGDFDLDLSYVTERIIAMGFPTPSNNFEGLYRNPMEEVQRFFNTRHTGHYKVYNLCSERDYEPESFNHMVARYPIDDHNCPDFKLVLDFCQDVKRYLAIDPKNVAAVHCKAGKGRTGTMIGSLMLYLKLFDTAKESLEFFGEKRIRNKKGVTIPSQRRYVHYFENYLKNYERVGKPFPFDGIRVALRRIRISPIPKGGISPTFKIHRPDGAKIYDHKKHHAIVASKPKALYYEVECNIVVRGDFKFLFVNQNALKKEEKMFWCWLNSAFVVEDCYVCLIKDEIDGAVKDKKCRTFPKDFKLELFFDKELSADAEECKVTEDADEYANNDLEEKEEPPEEDDKLTELREDFDEKQQLNDDEDEF